MTKFVESVETDPLGTRPQPSPLFTIPLGHTGFFLLPGLVLLPKCHCNINKNHQEIKATAKDERVEENRLTMCLPEI